MLTKTELPLYVPDPVLCFALAYQQAMLASLTMAMAGTTPAFPVAA